jgi:serine/threonine-protein kinase
MSPENPSLPEVGDLVGGRFRIVDHLGTGGFGTVYEAIQENVGREVALKFLTPGVAEDPINVERFRREAYHVSQLHHPHTITLYDYGQTDDGLVYMVMELLDGISLAQTVEDEGALALARAAHIFIAVLKSLSEAHQNGLVHRDLKPENIYLCDMFGEQDYVKVLDFGVAKMTRSGGDEEDAESDLTKQGHIFGTPMYMAPEQACDEPITPATDVYALGLLLFEMITGLPPVTGKSRMEVIHKQIKDPVPELPEALVGTPLGDIIEQAAKKDETSRFQDAGEFLEAFITASRAMNIVPRPKGGTGPEMAMEAGAEASSPGAGEGAGTADEPAAEEPSDRTTQRAEAQVDEYPPADDADTDRPGPAATPDEQGGATPPDRPGQSAPAADEAGGSEETTQIIRSDAAADGGTEPAAEYDLPLVGRDETLGELSDIVDEAFRTASGHIVLMEGESGVGKSRVLHEFAGQLVDRGVDVAMGHFHQQAPPMEGVREALSDYWGVAHRERDEVERAIRADLDPREEFTEEEIEFVVDFLRPEAVAETAVPESREEAQALYARLERLLLKLADRNPVFLAFEDIHYSDSATLAFLEYLAVTLRTQDARIVVALTLRPEQRGVNPELEPSLQKMNANIGVGFTRVPVKRLRGRDLAYLLDAIKPLESRLKERIGWLSQGVPLHAIQIIRYLDNEGSLVRDGDRWALESGSPREIDLPPDLLDLMQLRIEQAAQKYRDSDQLQVVLEWLAVLGMRTPVKLLRRIARQADSLDPSTLEETLEFLDQQGLLRHLQYHNLPCVEFDNSLLRETLLDDLDGQWKNRRYNRLAADHKVDFYRDRDMEVPLVEIADHWRKAGELEQYRDALYEAARRSMRRYDPRGARDRYRELLPLLEELDQTGEMWVETRLALGELSRRFGEFGVAEEHLRAVIDRTDPSEPEHQRAMRGVGELLVVQARYEEARQYYRQALQYSRQRGRDDLQGIAESLIGLSKIALMQGEASEGQKVRQQLEEMLPALPEGEISGKVLVHLAETARRLGRLSERYDYLVRARAQLEKSDDKKALGEALIALGSSMMEPSMNAQDRFERAGSILREALELMRSVGDRHGVAEAFRSLARLEIETGDYEAAVVTGEKALRIHEALGAPLNIGLTLRRLGVAKILGGRIEPALEDCDRAIQYLEQVGDKMAVADVLFAKGVAAMNQFDFETGRSELGEARRIKESFGSSWELFDVRNHLAIVAMWFGKFEEAERMLELTLEHVDEHGTAEDRAVARSLMGLLRCFQSRLHLAALEMGRARADAEDLGTPRVTDFCEANAAFYAKLTNNESTYNELIDNVTEAKVLNDIQPVTWLELLDRMANHVADREPSRQSARVMKTVATFWEAFGYPDRQTQLIETIGQLGIDADVGRL